jgi:hypothetical protein
MENSSPTCFHTKQAVRSRHVSHTVASSHQFWGATDKPSPTWFWGPNHQTAAAGFEAHTEKSEPPVLRSNREKSSPSVLRSNRRKPSQLFWGQTTDKPSTLVLSLNQETCVTMRQANTILQMKQRQMVKLMNPPRFKFKLHQVNYSSQSNQETDYLVSQSPHWWVHWQ